MKRFQIACFSETPFCFPVVCVSHGSYVSLLCQCYRYAIVRDMTAAGLGLNKFCYAGLIAAHRNKTPDATVTDDTATKVIYQNISISWVGLFVHCCDILILFFFAERLLSLLNNQKGGHQLKHRVTLLRM